MIERDRNEHLAKVSIAKVRIQNSYIIRYYENLHHYVTPPALDKLREQYYIFNDDKKENLEFTIALRFLHDLPCYHEISLLCEKDPAFYIELDLIGKNWWPNPS